MLGLIDALELLAALAALSGMRMHEVLQFSLSLFDFDSKAKMSCDEVVLCLKSSAFGLCKLASGSREQQQLLHPFPREEALEQLVHDIFSRFITGEVDDMSKVAVATLVQALCEHPDVISWYTYYGNVTTTVGTVATTNSSSSDAALLWSLAVRAPAEHSEAYWRTPKKPAAAAATGSLQPWQTTALMLVPSAQAGSSAAPPAAPAGSLTPAWVHGFDAEVARNNAFYNFQGKPVYTGESSSS